MKVRNWRDVQPVVGHDNAIIYSIYKQRREGAEDDDAQLIGLQNVAIMMLQSGKASDYHQHKTKEQLFYFIEGHGKMLIDDHLHEVRDGTAVHVPPPTKHQVRNDGDDWLRYLIITTIIEPQAD